MKSGKIRGRKGGFSLVEILMVILAIGIITAIAVPVLGRFDNVARDSKNQKNAKTAASVAAAAKVAGHDFVANASFPNSQHHVLIAISNGHTITDAGSPFEGSVFSLPALDTTGVYGAQKYLEVVNGELRYNPDGDSVDPVEPAP